MEFWDIYDSDKKQTGRTMKRNDWNLKNGEYHLTVLGVIHRPDGRFLITRRVMTKAWAPGWWEVSGGAVQAGEDSKVAVVREIREETGLDVSNCPDGYRFTYRRDNPDEGDNYFVDERFKASGRRNNGISLSNTRRDQGTRQTGNFSAL